MTDLRKAAEMALEALDEVTGWQWAGPMRVMDEVEDAIEAIRQALAQPEREWVGLTDEEIKGILDCGRGGLVDIKKAEQLLKEKNT